MTYFVKGFRYDTGWDHCGESVYTTFKTKKEAETFIKELLNREKNTFTVKQLTIIRGEIMDIMTETAVITKVDIHKKHGDSSGVNG